jgi:hypothetical protein
VSNEVPGLPGGDDGRPRDDLRVSDAHRDHVVALLQVAAVDGRLSSGELDERLGIALTARTYGELVAVAVDLASAPLGPIPESEVEGRIECRSSSVARDGRWLVPKRLTVHVTNGNVKLDFTQAVIVHPSLVINVDLIGSKLTLVTKPGLAVDTGDLTTSGSYVKIRAPRGEVPVSLRIELSGMLRGSHIAVGPIGRLSLGRRRDVQA